MFRIHKLPLLIFSLLGYLTILFTLSGSATPAYGQEVVPGVPSLAKALMRLCYLPTIFARRAFELIQKPNLY